MIKLPFTLITLVIIVIIITFVFFRHMGIYKLNEEIINLIVDYDKRHPGGKDLPPSDKLFIPHNKMVWSFKKLTIEKWLDVETIKKLKS